MIIVRKSQLKELEKKRRRNNCQMLLTGLLIGAAIGSLLALLFTPYEGVETRRRIGDKTGSLKNKCLGLLSCNGSFKCCCSGEECDDDNCCDCQCEAAEE